MVLRQSNGPGGGNLSLSAKLRACPTLAAGRDNTFGMSLRSRQMGRVAGAHESRTHPRQRELPRNGFEDREGHRAPSAPPQVSPDGGGHTFHSIVTAIGRFDSKIDSNTDELTATVADGGGRAGSIPNGRRTSANGPVRRAAELKAARASGPLPLPCVVTVAGCQYRTGQNQRGRAGGAVSWDWQPMRRG